MGCRDKVLVVDDQEGIRKLLGEACSLLGYHVETASSGTEALKLAENGEFKAALIDLKMPGLNGMETLEKMHLLDPEIKVALMTGYGEMYVSEDTGRRVVYRIIRKPFDLEEIKIFLNDVFTD